MKEKEAVLKAIEEIGLPAKTGDIAKRTGLDRNIVQKILNELSIEGKVILDRCYNKVLKRGGNNG
ncbi:MAG: MarR family transcriptional regulator [Aquificota bacterium]|nr:MAG: MarR family transcriptional regulator [Aquificota bacterium]